MSIDHRIPLPIPEAVQKTKAFYKVEFNQDLTDAEAYEICADVVGWLWLNIRVNLTAEEEETGEPNAILEQLRSEKSLRHPEQTVTSAADSKARKAPSNKSRKSSKGTNPSDDLVRSEGV